MRLNGTVECVFWVAGNLEWFFSIDDRWETLIMPMNNGQKKFRAFYT